MTSNWMFVGAAFAVTWGTVLGYLFHLHRTMRRARSLFDMSTKTGAR